MIVRRVEALSKFLDSDDGKNLLVGVKRATNIVRIEEKKDGRSFHGDERPAADQGRGERAAPAVTVAIAKARKATENRISTPP